MHRLLSLNPGSNQVLGKLLRLNNRRRRKIRFLLFRSASPTFKGLCADIDSHCQSDGLLKLSQSLMVNPFPTLGYRAFSLRD